MTNDASFKPSVPFIKAGQAVTTDRWSTFDDDGGYPIHADDQSDIDTSSQEAPQHFPWTQWSQLPKVEREAEIKEFAKHNSSLEESDAVGHHRSRRPFPYYDALDQKEMETSDQHQIDSLTGEASANADTDRPDWFQIHHNDGIKDGYLDAAQDEVSTNTKAPGCTYVITHYPVEPYGHGQWICPPNELDQTAAQDAGQQVGALSVAAEPLAL